MRQRPLLILALALTLGCASSKASNDTGNSTSDTAATNDSTTATDTDAPKDQVSTTNDSATVKDTTTGQEESTTPPLDVADTGGPLTPVPCSVLANLDPQKKKIGAPCTADAECQTNNCFSENWLNGFKFCTARCQSCPNTCAEWPNATDTDNKCLILTANGSNQSKYKAFCVATCDEVSVAGDVSCQTLDGSFQCVSKNFSEVTPTNFYKFCLPPGL